MIISRSIHVAENVLFFKNLSWEAFLLVGKSDDILVEEGGGVRGFPVFSGCPPPQSTRTKSH